MSDKPAGYGLKQFPRLVVYLSPETREGLQRLAFERYVGQGGHMAMGRLARELLEEYVKTHPPTSGRPSKKTFGLRASAEAAATVAA